MIMMNIMRWKNDNFSLRLSLPFFFYIVSHSNGNEMKEKAELKEKKIRLKIQMKENKWMVLNLMIVGKLGAFLC